MYTCMPAHMYAYILVCACVWLCVGDLCVHFHSPAVAGNVHLPRKEAAHNYKFHSEEHKERRRRWTGQSKRHIFIVHSWTFTADDHLCVCDGTCGWRKLSRNYTLLSGWPIIFLKCERDDSARALLSMMAEKFKQTEKRGLNQVHINQRVIWRTQARTVHWSTSLNIRHWLWKVCEGSVTLILILTTEAAQSTPMWIHLKMSFSLCFGLSHIMRMFFPPQKI